MNRILEFLPSQEEAVVSRVLMLVHQAIDQHLPSAGQANRQFTKTLYSEYSDDADKTSTSAVPELADEAPAAKESSGFFGSNEVTSPGTAATAAAMAAIAADTEPEQDSGPSERGERGEKTERHDRGDRSEKGEKSSRGSSKIPMRKPSSLGDYTATERTLIGEGPDWVTRITLVLLITGLMLLAYVLIS